MEPILKEIPFLPDDLIETGNQYLEYYPANKNNFINALKSQYGSVRANFKGSLEMKYVNGVMVQVFWTEPSGKNLTFYINNESYSGIQPDYAPLVHPATTATVAIDAAIPQTASELSQLINQTYTYLDYYFDIYISPVDFLYKYGGKTFPLPILTANFSVAPFYVQMRMLFGFQMDAIIKVPRILELYHWLKLNREQLGEVLTPYNAFLLSEQERLRQAETDSLKLFMDAKNTQTIILSNTSNSASQIIQSTKNQVANLKIAALGLYG